jgi:hypothetical protein
MALGAVTVLYEWVGGTSQRARIADVVLGTGANYPTGGEPLDPTKFELHDIVTFVPCGVARATADGATCRTVSYNHATKKMQVYTTASAEAANNSDQSGYTVRLYLEGT